MRLQKRKTLLAVVILVIVAAALVLVWRLTAPTGETGAKTVTVQVVHGDGTAKDFTLETGDDQHQRGHHPHCRRRPLRADLHGGL